MSTGPATLSREGVPGKAFGVTGLWGHRSEEPQALMSPMPPSPGPSAPQPLHWCRHMEAFSEAANGPPTPPGLDSCVLGPSAEGGRPAAACWKVSAGTPMTWPAGGQAMGTLGMGPPLRDGGWSGCLQAGGLPEGSCVCPGTQRRGGPPPLPHLPPPGVKVGAQDKGTQDPSPGPSSVVRGRERGQFLGFLSS